MLASQSLELSTQALTSLTITSSFLMVTLGGGRRHLGQSEPDTHPGGYDMPLASLSWSDQTRVAQLPSTLRLSAFSHLPDIKIVNPM